ncbi:MAG: TVP38/TMEM64 family protein [Opitutales bacterium]
MTQAPNENSSTHASKSKPLLKVTLLIGAVLALFVASRFLPVEAWLKDFNQWIADLGTVGLVVFVFAYAAFALLMLPGAILTIGAGLIFGLGWGFVAVSVGSTLGASLAFLLGRFVARDRIRELTAGKPKFQQIDRAIGERGAKLIFLLRLSPIVPFNLSNYFYGLTAVRFWPYVLASWLGMMPGTLAYVYFGTLGRAAAQSATDAGPERGPLEWTLLAVGLAATLAVTIWVSKIARNAIQETEAIPAEPTEDL